MRTRLGQLINSVRRPWLAVFLSMCGGHALRAQIPLLTQLGTAQHAPGAEWSQLQTEHFTVIFPRAMLGEARKAARYLESYYSPLGRSLRSRAERLPVVLNNQSLVSNAFVGWSPRRSVWYPLPPASSEFAGPLDWYQLLAVHEGRHVAQERAIRTGWIGAASKVFGEGTTAFLGSLYFPAWFWEGDAVGMETALTTMGRGRQPVFQQRSRALTLSGQRFSYAQMWQGSYRTALPDWYEYGYALTTYARRHFGDSVWARAIRSAARNPIPPIALSMALKGVTGQSLGEMHLGAMRELDSLWRDQMRSLDTLQVTLRTTSTAPYHIWGAPQFLDDSTIVASFTDLDHTTRLVRVTSTQQETVARRINLSSDVPFHLAAGRVVWSEHETDPRYAEQDFAVIKLLDIASGEVRRLTDRSKYLAPALRSDGKEIVAVHFSPDRVASLVFLDAESGTERRERFTSTRYLQAPMWTADDRGVLFVAVDPDSGNALMQLDLATRSVREVVPWTRTAIVRPRAAGRHVFYGSSASGLDNVWAVDTLTRVQYQVTRRPYGAYTPAASPDGRRLVFADYGPNGFDIADVRVDTTQWRPAHLVEREAVEYAEPLAAQEGGAVGPISKALFDTLSSRPYGGLRTLFNLHSLALAPTSDGINAGLALMSQNLLGTMASTLGVVSNSEEGTNAVEMGLSYAGRPVIVDAAMRVGSRAGSILEDGKTRKYSWRERSVTTALRLPLTRNYGQTRQSLIFSTGLGLTHISDQPISVRLSNNNGTLSTATHLVQLAHLRARAYRDLYPTGIVLRGRLRHTPFGGSYTGRSLSLQSSLLAPGLLPNHAFVVDVSQEERRVGNYRFSSDVPFVRGFGRRFHEHFTRVATTYHLPLAYPDIALGPVAYINRIQGAAFGDWGRGTSAGAPSRRYGSIGTEITGDVALLGTRTFVRMGIRYGKQLTGTRSTINEFVLSLPF